MNNWEIDVNVLIIFFVREDVLKETFEAVRKARPRRLLLWQDGPRKNKKDDIEKINKCREIVSNIDWDCEVYRNYNENNIGCDPSIFYAYNWAFSIVDKCIFLEDDQVPNQSFFRFCKELLDYYEKDDRISHICGYNYTEITESCKEDYLFSLFGSGAWATWKRVVKEWDGSYSFLDNKENISNLIKRYGKIAEESFKTAERHRKTKKEFWESIVGCNCLLNNHLVIIPKKNLVSNKGLTENAAHSSANMKFLPKVTRKLFYMSTYEIEFPLHHPKNKIINMKYIHEVCNIMGLGKPVLSLKRRLEGKLNRIKYKLNLKIRFILGLKSEKR